MSKRRAEDDVETDELSLQFKYATIETEEDEDDNDDNEDENAHDSPKRKGDSTTHLCPLSLLGLWNKLRWIAPHVWEQVTNRAQEPHPLLLRLYVSRHLKINASNPVHVNLTLLLNCMTKL
jgi:hypothetical protein